MIRWGKSEDDFQECYQTYGPRVRRSLTSMVRNVAVAEELTQESFLKAWQSLPSFGFRSTLSTWVFQVAINTARDWLRSHKHHEQYVDEGSYESFSPETRAIEEALGELEEEVRTLLILHYYEGMDLKEIGTVSGVPEGTVKSRLHSAKAKMKVILMKKGFEV